MKIRKQCYELTLEDVEKTPVWEFATDEEAEEEQDEATVRPSEYSGSLELLNYETVLIRARFKIADGTLMRGWITAPDTEEDRKSLSILQPVIVTNLGQVLFWHGMFKPKAQELADFYAKLGRSAEKVFPIEFTSDVELVGGTVNGIIEGFMFLEWVETETPGEEIETTRLVT